MPEQLDDERNRRFLYREFAAKSWLDRTTAAINRLNGHMDRWFGEKTPGYRALDRCLPIARQTPPGLLNQALRQ